MRPTDLPTAPIAAGTHAATLANGGFEGPRSTPGQVDYALIDQSLVNGWTTTETHGQIEP